MKVSFVLLAHEAPDELRTLIETLLACGSDVFVHYDANSRYDLKRSVASWGLEKFDGKLFHAKRVRVVWGEWSVVQATLNCLNVARKIGYNADYLMLLSGSCMPIKPVLLLEQHLAENSGFDFIETVNAIEQQWIRRGIQRERWELFHFLNWRKRPNLFSWVLRLQQKLRIKRKLPLAHIPFMGSQWWCLRTSTIDKILALLDFYPGMVRFYMRTWVPDELFFQTMVGNLIPAGELCAEILTRYRFNSWGIPRVYYDDDLPELLAENTYFARKISARANKLKNALSSIGLMGEADYFRMVHDSNHELAVALRRTIEFRSEIADLSWFGLATSSMNEYDYIKSIPNNFVVVVAHNERLRQRALNDLSLVPGIDVCGDILGCQQLEFWIRAPSLAGYSVDSGRVAKHKWHLFLGELAVHAKGKALAFSLGNNPLPYLEVLRWKANLTVIALDEVDDDSVEHWCLDALYLNSKVGLALMQGGYCKFIRTPYDEFRNFIRTHGVAAKDINAVVCQLTHQIDERCGSSTNRVKSLHAVPVVVVCTPDERWTDEVLGRFSQHDGIAVLRNGLSPVMSDLDFDGWHAYVSDLVCQVGGRILLSPMLYEQKFLLEILRRQANVTIIVIEQPIELAATALAELGAVWEEQQNRMQELCQIRKLLQERICAAYFVDGIEQQGFDAIVETLRGYASVRMELNEVKPAMSTDKTASAFPMN